MNAGFRPRETPFDVRLRCGMLVFALAPLVSDVYFTAVRKAVVPIWVCSIKIPC